MVHMRVVFTVLFFSLALFSSSVAMPYTEPHEDVAENQFSLNNETYTLVSIDGTETLLLSSNNTPITSFEQIRTILNEKTRKDARLSESKQHLRELLLLFNSSREPEESLCKKYTGTDRFSCTDKPSCLFACRSVPVCQGIVGAEGFLEELALWVNLTSQLDSLVSFALSYVNTIEYSQDAQALLPILNDLRTITTKIDNTKIIRECGDCFTFCYKSDFNLSSLDESTALLQKLKSDLLPLENNPARARAIEEATQTRLSYLSTRDARYRALSQKVLSQKQELSFRAEKSLECINNREGLNSLDTLNNLTKLILEHGNRKEFLLAFSYEEEFDALVHEVEEAIRRNERDCELVKNATTTLVQKVQQATTLAKGYPSFSPQLYSLSGRTEELLSKTKKPLAKYEMSDVISHAEELSREADELMVNVSIYKHRCIEQCKQTQAQKGEGNPTKIESFCQEECGPQICNYNGACDFDENKRYCPEDCPPPLCPLSVLFIIGTFFLFLLPLRSLPTCF